MYYKNFISRFVLRKNFLSRVKMRLAIEKRKLVKNEFDDLAFLYSAIHRTPKVIFDCGANVGYVSYQFYKRFEKAKIYAFEPNPSVFSVLSKNLLAESNHILPFNYGIGNQNGELDFFKNNNTGTSSFLEPNDFHKSQLARKYKKIKVPIISIADFCTDYQIENISILKLDIEGFELKALQGCEEMLKNGQIEFVFAEVNLIPTYDGQCLIEEVISYLRGLNYIPYNFYGNNETKLRESIITNVLFMSPRIAQEFISHNGENSVYVNKTNL